MALYPATIALVSGAYSIGSALSGASAVPMTDGMGLAAWLMLLIGVVAVVHGIVLLTPAAAMLGGSSGPLMLLWALVMLGIQAIGAARMDGMMRGTQVDFGMVALAVLMLASGAIMIARPMDVGRGD
jgi:hypothetical protein